MATVRAMPETAKGEVRWQAMVRRGGHELSRTFPDRKRADKWAKDVEAALSIDSPRTPFNREDWLATSPSKREVRKRFIADANPTPTPSWTLDRALTLYGDIISPKKASPAQEKTRIKNLKEALGTRTLAGLRLEHVQEYADARKALGKGPSTVRLDIMQLRALYKVARGPKPHGWGVSLPGAHPCQGVELDPIPAGRDRRLQDADEPASGQEPGENEEAAIRRHLAAQPDGSLLLDIFSLVLLTGMRRGEILGLVRSEVSRAGKIWRIIKHKHKTMHRGHKRMVVLAPEAVLVIQRRMEGVEEHGRLFPLSETRLKHYFRKAARLAGCADVRFHDLRHEAISRMADRGLNLGELGAQSGHRSAQMLLRYVNGRSKDILGKLS